MSKNISSTTIPVATNQSKFRQSPPLINSTAMTTTMASTVKEFGVSGTAACMAHFIHHPLYTLKSQMMYHGHNFSIRRFAGQVVNQPTFLYNGKLIKLITL